MLHYLSRCLPFSWSRGIEKRNGCRRHSIKTSSSDKFILWWDKSSCSSLWWRAFSIWAIVWITTRVSVISSTVQLCNRLVYATCNGWLSVSKFLRTAALRALSLRTIFQSVGELVNECALFVTSGHAYRALRLNGRTVVVYDFKYLGCTILPNGQAAIGVNLRIDVAQTVLLQLRKTGFETRSVSKPNSGLLILQSD